MVIWLVETVGALGYPGIFVMMALESTFMPVPSEAVMIPAGYLVHEGRMSFTLSLIAGVLGSIVGSYVNYYLALWLGRPFIIRYGRYAGVSPRKFEKVDEYFRNHGEITIFIGRLIPVVRHLISFPAGLGRMKHGKFMLYTSVGAGIWAAILLGVGFAIGKNEALIKQYMTQITIGIIIFSAIVVAAYIWFKKSFFGKPKA